MFTRIDNNVLTNGGRNSLKGQFREIFSPLFLQTFTFTGLLRKDRILSIVWKFQLSVFNEYTSVSKFTVKWTLIL